MTSSCVYCVALQPHQSGNAPLRLEHVKPTMYDHMDVFCKYRQMKEKRKKIRQAKHRILRFDSKFTNFNVSLKSEESVKNSSTHALCKFKQKLQNLNDDYEVIKNPNIQEINGIGDNIENLKLLNCQKNKSLPNIRRHPIKCSVNSCRKTIGVTSVFGHFIRDHEQEFPIDFNEIENGQRSVLSLYASNFELNKIACLGILAYGGKSPKERPGILGICTKNVLLPQKYLHLRYHLPVIIFGYKTTICDMLKNRKLASKLYPFCSKEEEIYVIWLSTIETTKRIFCTITAFDENRCASLSTIHEVQNLLSLKNPSEFLSNSSNYLWLCSGDINNLSNYEKNSIELEIYIRMYDK